MKNKFLFLALIATFSTCIISCKKDNTGEQLANNKALAGQVLTDLSANSNQNTYNDLKAKAEDLDSKIQLFISDPSESNLQLCRQLWKDTRSAWEQSEGFLYGPVSTNNIDPRIDTWPVNYTDLDSLLNGSQAFNTTYIDGLEDALKGFHPIEYLIFGLDGNKSATSFTSGEKEYLAALSLNLKTLTTDLANSWNPASSGNYHSQLVGAGSSSTIYSTTKKAFEEIVNAMVGICDEVANGKIEDPFINQDPMLEESPFSQNSLVDFTHNILSVQNVYQGKYANKDGKGIEDLVMAKNLSLHLKLKGQMSSVIEALGKITLPFGEAIISQPVQIGNAQKAIRDLKTTLETELLPFVQMYY